MGHAAVSNRANDDSGLLNCVEHPVVADARGPKPFEAAQESLAHRLGLDADERDRFQNSFANHSR